MSSSLEVTKVVKPKVSGDFYDLKFPFREYYGDPVDVILETENIEELTAMKLMASNEQKKALDRLIEAIEKYDRIQVKEVW